jgi:hypothetical protein
MTDREQLQDLIASYERLATDQEARADNVLAMGMRIGWDEFSMATEAELRQSAEASRMLAQEVRDGMGD